MFNFCCLFFLFVSIIIAVAVFLCWILAVTLDESEHIVICVSESHSLCNILHSRFEREKKRKLVSFGAHLRRIAHTQRPSETITIIIIMNAREHYPKINCIDIIQLIYHERTINICMLFVCCVQIC